MTPREQTPDETAEQDEARREAYEAWKSAGTVTPSKASMSDLTLRAAAQHAQAIGDSAAERQIDGVLEGRGSR